MSRVVFLLAVSIALAGCAASFRPYALRPIMWRDQDTSPFAGPPPETYTDWMWDAADQTVFRQASQALRYERGREAIDVNALDEVPDSSWYTNRISYRDLSAEELARGACPEGPIAPPPYVVVMGKEGGTFPGAVVRAGDGRTYLFKHDAWQPERGTAASAIASRLVYAAGYRTPCNVVVPVRGEDFSIAHGARRGRGSDEPFTPAHLYALLAGAGAVEGRTGRASMSMFLDDPLGGFRFDGINEHDPNDVVPHEHRRELRALYVLSAWLNHVDSRAENNLDVWVETAPGRGHLEHVILDVDDSFGIIWNADLEHRMSRRLGNAHYLDLEQILGDLATLGFAERAYRDATPGPAFPVFGYYDVERFDPDDWRPGYPNPAFERRTEADCAWMARIISRFREPEIRALVTTGRFSRELYDEELVRILLGRRERLLERYLVRLSPLSFPEVSQGRLCVRDLAVESGLRGTAEREYAARRYVGTPPRAVDDRLAIARDGSRVCVPLPRSASAAQPRYHVIDLIAATPGRERSHPARVHLWEIAPGVHRIAGLERPDSDDAP